MEGEKQYYSVPEAEQNPADFSFGSSYQQDLNHISNRKRRINSVLIAAGGIIAIGLGLFQIYYNISHPFDSLLGNGAAMDFATADQTSATADAALQNKDTDGDSLSDYDELNVYKTSPYIADSDSDGVNDNQEIKAGTDPNCPSGQICSGFSPTVGTSTASVPTFTTMPQAQTQTSLQVSASTIRQMLLAQGVSQSDLDGITDEELMTLYSESMQANPDLAAAVGQSAITTPQVPANTTVTGNVSPQTGNINLASFGVKSVDDLKNLSGAQVRQLMIEAGASQSMLSSVSDDQLKQIFLQKIEEQASQ